MQSVMGELLTANECVAGRHMRVHVNLGSLAFALLTNMQAGMLKKTVYEEIKLEKNCLL